MKVFPSESRESMNLFGFESTIYKISLSDSVDKSQLVLKVKLDQPLPPGFRIDSHAYNNMVCLKNSQYGGIWTISSFGEDKSELLCHVPSQVLAEVSEKGYCFDWELDQPQGFDFFNEKKESNENMKIVKRRPVDGTKKARLFFANHIYLFCKINIYNISLIDTVNQCYSCDFFSEFRVRGITEEDTPSFVEQFLKCYSLDKRIACLREISEDYREDWSSFSYSGLNSGLFDYCYKTRIKAVISQRMQLQMFPFDEQTLEIVLTVNIPNCIVLVNNQEFPSVFQSRSFQLDDIFEVVHGEFIFSSVKESNASESSSGYVYPLYISKLYLSRRPGYYISNVLIPIFFISAVSVVSFAINEDGSKMDSGSRLSLTLTLLLTAVAYKFIVAATLPQLSYSTLLDNYVWFCFGFILTIAIENAVYASLAHKFPSVRYREVYAMIILLGCFVSGTILWFVYAYRLLSVRKARNDELFRKELESRREGKLRLKGAS